MGVRTSRGSGRTRSSGGTSGPAHAGVVEEAGSPRADAPAAEAVPTRAPVGGRRAARAKRNKRTSRNTDDRNPTRSGIQYPSPRYRRRDEAETPRRPKARPSLRKVRRGPDRGRDRRRQGQAHPQGARGPRRRRLRSTEATEELRQLAGRGASRAVQELARAAEAVNAGHERDAARILRPLRDAYPDAAAVRELLGLVPLPARPVSGRVP